MILVVSSGTHATLTEICFPSNEYSAHANGAKSDKTELLTSEVVERCESMSPSSPNDMKDVLQLRRLCSIPALPPGPFHPSRILR